MPKKFWLLNNDFLFQSHSKRFFLTLENDDFPYIDAIRELEKLVTSKCLRDKFDCVVSSNTLMKMRVIDYYNGKEEIVAMDEELPILIFVVLHTKIPNLMSQISFVDDYLSNFPDFEVEKRFLMNTQVPFYFSP